MIYFEKEDVLHLTLADEAETASVEISPDITAELNENGELIASPLNAWDKPHN